MINQTNTVAQKELRFNSAKNYFATLIIVLGIFFSFTESGNAQFTCPSGYNQITVTQTLPSGCQVQTVFCHKLNVVTGTMFITIGPVTFLPPFTNCNGLQIDNNFWDAIYDEIYKKLCMLSQIPPCPPPLLGNVEIRRQQCLKSLWVNDDPLQGVQLYPCDSGFDCIRAYRMCCNSDGSITKVLISNYTNGSASCPPIDNYTIPSPKYSYENVTCYQYPCE